MAYNFDKIWERSGCDATKWDSPRKPQCQVYTEAESFVPMWIADMDFATPDFVVEAMKERMEHPIFGYFATPKRYFDAIRFWQRERYGVSYEIENGNIMYQNSVLGGVASFLSVYTLPGEAVLLNSPCYTAFQTTIHNLGRKICASELVKDGDGIYRMNFDEMERMMVENRISVMIFCSPHNPTGRVWARWEIQAVTELCARHGVKLVSDEIWADFIMEKDLRHIPTQTVSETARKITMALYAPSNVFNVAGLVGAYALIYDRQMMNKIAAYAKSTHYNETNILCCYSVIGGYENGGGWVDELVRYIRENQEYMVNYLETHFEGVKAYLPEGTYLLWVDISRCGMDYDEAFGKMIAAGVLPNSGKAFMGRNHIRFNAACPRSMCEEAMKRLHGVFRGKAV